MKKFWLPTVLIFLWASAVFSWEEITIDRFAGLGARAMGMGGAYVAVAEDFTATYWNPAGLAQIRRFELYGGICQRQDAATVHFYDTPWHDQITRTTSDPLGIVIPIPTYRGSLVFSIGYLPIEVFDNVFGKEWFSQETGQHKERRDKDEGGLGIYAIAGAIDISPSVSLGAAVGLWNGSDTFSQKLLIWSDAEKKSDISSQGQDIIEVRYREFEDKYSAFSVRVGALFRVPGGIRVGLVVSSPVQYKVEEKWKWKEARWDTSGYSSYRVRLPWVFDGGLSWTVPGLVTVGLGLSHSDWTQTRYDEPPEEGITNEDFRERYQATTRFHIGGEILLPLVPVRVRGGYYRDPLPFLGPSKEKGPKIEIQDQRDYWTFGMGVLIDRVLALDLAYVRGGFTQKEGNITERHKQTRIFLSAAYRF